MQSLTRAHTLAGLSAKRFLPRQTGMPQQPRSFTSTRTALKSQFFTARRPRPCSTMDRLQILTRSHGSSGGWGQPHRFASTQRMVYTIIAMNAVVFGAWAYAKATSDIHLQKTLMNNVTLSWYNMNAKRYWTVITSAFSHRDFFHILFNMMSLNAFAGVLYFAGGVGVGAPHVAALFLGSAAAGSAAFLYQKKPKIDRKWGPHGQHGLAAMAAGLGASGAVMGFATVAACLAPLQQMYINFIPVPIPMYVLTGAYIAIDLFYLGQDDLIGHSAHLGGALFGVVYYLAALRGYGGISQLARHLVRRR